MSKNVRAETHPLSKFHENLFSSFHVIQLTKKLTSGHGWKHNLLGGGNYAMNDDINANYKSETVNYAT